MAKSKVKQTWALMLGELRHISAALEDRHLPYSCTVCGSSVRPHDESKPGKRKCVPAHFEHWPRNLDCPLKSNYVRVSER